MKLVDLVYEVGIVDFLINKVTDDPNLPLERFQMPAYIGVNVERFLQTRIFTRHFIKRYFKIITLRSFTFRKYLDMLALFYFII